ncbi:hypothetical protein Pelo_1922 [Pelomyxa schiedti]|nr:hypothetical protein Pelo_1922 [Pelomyxa schiedti]
MDFACHIPTTKRTILSEIKHLNFDPKRLAAVMPLGDLQRGAENPTTFDDDAEDMLSCLDIAQDICHRISDNQAYEMDEDEEVYIRSRYDFKEDACGVSVDTCLTRWVGEWLESTPFEENCAIPLLNLAATVAQSARMHELTWPSTLKSSVHHSKKFCDPMMNTTLALTCRLGKLHIVQYLVDSLGVSPATNYPIFDTLASQSDTTEVVLARASNIG